MQHVIEAQAEAVSVLIFGFFVCGPWVELAAAADSTSAEGRMEGVAAAAADGAVEAAAEELALAGGAGATWPENNKRHKFGGEENLGEPGRLEKKNGEDRGDLGKRAGKNR
jgi:hypothetical protein